MNYVTNAIADIYRLSTCLNDVSRLERIGTFQDKTRHHLIDCESKRRRKHMTIEQLSISSSMYLSWYPPYVFRYSVLVRSTELGGYCIILGRALMIRRLFFFVSCQIIDTLSTYFCVGLLLFIVFV
jgi:hypothetical protein